MNAIEDRLLAHARVLRSRGLALPPDGQPPAEILDSWVRCAEAGLDMAMPPPQQIVESGELRQRRERVDYLRRLALAELETLFQQIAGSNFLLAFADADGVILDRYADNRFSMSQSGSPILEGSCWAETLCGTNGLGTALASGHSVAVNGLEHYLLPLGQISCTATPVHDADGRVVGALDASSYFESRQRHTQALVQMAAAQIENRLLVHQLRDALVLAIHPRSEFLGTISAGLLAFDGIGRLRAANARAGALLAGLTLDRGATTFEELFAEPYEHVLARLQRQPEVGLRDALGSRLVVRALSGGGAVGGPGRRPAHATPAPVAAGGPAAPGASAPSRPSADRTVRSPAAAELPPRRTPVLHSAGVRGLPGWIAEDPRVQEALATVEAAVRMQAPIWIQGETGTGKEGLARHAHQASGRSGEFVAVNCAALPAELFEAELFGHVGGAYTGARREGAPGLIVSADGGTLLLDEVRELPPPLQAALLRFLDDQQVRPVGGVRSRRVNVQLLAASHADLAAEVAAGRFRADLYHRLCTVQVSLPPLRERSDFATIARSLLAQLDAQADLSMAALAELRRQPWPGNCRELRAVLTRALLRRPPQGLIEPQTLAPMLTPSTRTASPLPAPTGAPTGTTAVEPDPASAPSEVEGHGHIASELQRHATATVRATYELCGGNISLTSRRLGISRTTVYRHLRAAGFTGLPPTAGPGNRGDRHA